MDSDSEDAKVKKGQTTPERVKLIVPSYDKCCLWDNPKVSTCGPTSHSKLSFPS